MSALRPVAIIGAGVTGLTAAFALRQRGLAVTVYEARARVGGVISSLREDGYLAEAGPHTLLETSPKITGLVAELGLQRRRLDSDPRAEARFIVRGGKPIPLPTSLFEFLRTPLFSARAKLRLLLEPFLPRSRAPEESVADFVRRRLGQEFLDYAIDPLVSGIYAGDPERLSLHHAFPKIAALEARYGSLVRGQILGAGERRRRGEISKMHAKKFSFDEGLQVLTDTLAERLGTAIALHSTVIAISRRADGWTVSVDCGGTLRHVEHAAVLFAGTAYQLAALRLETPAPADLGCFGQIYYPPVASVTLGFRRDQVAHPACGFGMLIPRVEGFRILGTVFSSALFPNRAPPGHVTLTSYLGGTNHPELALQPEEALVETTLADLRVILGVSGQPTWRQVSGYPQAIPQYELGYGRFKARMDELEQRAPGLFLAGHYRHGIGLSDSILSGLRAAERIAAWLRAGGAGVAGTAGAPRTASER